MNRKKSAIKVAFPLTIPVMLGYLFVGMAFGVVLSSRGFHAGWAALMSIFIYAGSMQFVAVDLLSSQAPLITAALVTLAVNFRHIFYGLSFIQDFDKAGAKKPYMIFSLTDETYSLLFSAQIPPDVDKSMVQFWIALLNQCYWVAGAIVGALAGAFIPFDTTGIDFAMTALFVVIFIEQWKALPTHLPALIGLGIAMGSLALLGGDQFIIPAMVLIAAALLGLKKPIGAALDAKQEGGAQ